MDPRSELEQLRKMKRLKELEAKARGASAPAAEPSTQDKIDAGLKDALESVDKGPMGKPGWANKAALALLPGAAPAAGIMGRIAQGALTGAATAEAMGPEAGHLHLPDPARSATGAAVGGITSGLLEGAGAALRKGADYGMQIATNQPKYTPGAGNRLADMGVWGTEGGMQKAISQRLPQEEEAIQQLASQIPDKTPGSDLVQGLKKREQFFKLPSSGEPSPLSASELAKIEKAAEGVRGIGEIPAVPPSVEIKTSPLVDQYGRNFTTEVHHAGAPGKPSQLEARDLLALKRHGDYQGYTASGNPATSTEADIGRSVADAARGRLNELNPQIGERLANEQALIKAKSGLDKEPGLPKSLMALLGLVPKSLPGGSAVISTGSAGFNALGKGLPKATDPLMRLLLSNQSEGQ